MSIITAISFSGTLTPATPFKAADPFTDPFVDPFALPFSPEANSKPLKKFAHEGSIVSGDFL